MTDFLIYFVFSVISYLLGSINTGILVSKILYNDDVRNYGSHNAGATNILRTYGKKAAAITVLGDALKGVIAILLVRLVYFCFKNAHLPDLRSVTYFAAFFAVLGHNFPVYFKFKGGKGVLTSITVIIMLDPFVGLATLVISILIMAADKIRFARFGYGCVYRGGACGIFPHRRFGICGFVRSACGSYHLPSPRKHCEACARNGIKARQEEKMNGKKIAVIGSGGWGCAVAVMLCSNGNDVTLWSWKEEERSAIEKNGETKNFCRALK